jgi:hypothetical protein
MDPIHDVGLGLKTRGITVLSIMEVTDGEERKPSNLIWAYTMNKGGGNPTLPEKGYICNFCSLFGGWQPRRNT